MAQSNPQTDTDHGPATDQRTLALVGCGAAKQDLSPTEVVPAKDLYTSNYFALKRRYAELYADEWGILSAEHGYIDADTRICTYDAVLEGRRDARDWAADGFADLRDRIDSSDIERVIMLAGTLYARPVEKYLRGLDDRDITVAYPMDGCGGIGEQMAFLKARVVAAEGE